MTNRQKWLLTGTLGWAISQVIVFYFEGGEYYLLHGGFKAITTLGVVWVSTVGTVELWKWSKKQ